MSTRLDSKSHRFGGDRLRTDGLPENRPARWGVVILGLAGLGLLLATPGCRLIKGAADLPGDAVRVVSPDQAPPAGPTAEDLQMQLLRFADEHVARFTAAIEETIKAAPAHRKFHLREIQAAFAMDVWAMASGQNAYANLLDLLVVISLSRTYTEDYWVPDVFGETGRPLLTAAIASEDEIWRIADEILTPAQEKELRAAIDSWQEAHSNPGDAMFTRALGFADAFTKETPATAGRKRPDSVFRFLKIDPLAGLDPATRELTKARMFAERALYIAQRMPVLLRWQTELLTHEVTQQPQVARALTNVVDFSETARRLADVAERLPDRLTAEREAILKELRDQSGNLAALAGQVEAALAQGSALATNTDTALRSFERVLDHFPPEPDEPDEPPAEPFRIQDYTEAAAAMEKTIRQATELLDRFDQVLGSTNLSQLTDQLDGAVQRAETGGRGLLDHAFARGLLLILAGCAGLLITLLLHRWLANHLPGGPSAARTTISRQDDSPPNPTA